MCGTPLHLRGTRRNSGLRYSSVFPSTSKTPKCRILTPRDLVPPVHVTINGSDLNREIVTREFDVHATCLVKRRTSICDGVRVNFPMTSPRSDGMRDFVILHDDFKSSILFLLNFFRSKPPPCSKLLLGLFPHWLHGTIPPELGFSHSFN
jgi:hypothetical protein